MAAPQLPRRVIARRVAAIGLGALGVIVAATLVLAAAAGFFDRDARHFFPGAGGATPPLGVLYVSGDMGLRFGMGPATSRTLAAAGVPVLGLSASTAFAAHRTRAELDAIVAQAVHDTLAQTGAARLVAVGQSFGADILQTGLAALPRDLRARIAAVVLVVPGDAVYFRADPTGLAYRGTPDSIAAATANALAWTPVTCIYGVAERDSLCPELRLAGATVIPLPGGHFLMNDHPRVARLVLAAVRRAAARR